MKRRAERAAAELAEAMAKEKVSRERMEELRGRLAAEKRLIARLARRIADLSTRIDEAQEELRRLEARRESAERLLARATAAAFAAARQEGGASPAGGRAERGRWFARLLLAHGAAQRRAILLAAERTRETKEGLERVLVRQEQAKEREVKVTRALASRTEAEARRLAEIDRRRKEKEKELRALRARIAAMEALVSRIEKRMARRERDAGRPPAGTPPPRFASLAGSLVPPLEGRVVGRFGAHRDPEFDVVIENRGIEIEAPAGAAIRAVGKGEVVFLGRVEGFGKVLIIRHGSGLFSVYGKAGSFSVKHGQQVTAGELVGRLPDGPGEKSVLYLELRAGGTAVDPLSVIPIPKG